MTYEVVNLKGKMVVGVRARTNNSAPDMEQVIGGLWNQFYQGGIHGSIVNLANQKALGIYTEYEEEEKGDYTVMVASEVTKAENVPQNACQMTIPAGKYAKFVIVGHMVTAVAKFWQELGKMDLDRSFVCDFEEYQNASIENAEIHMYIGIK